VPGKARGTGLLAWYIPNAAVSAVPRRMTAEKTHCSHSRADTKDILAPVRGRPGWGPAGLCKPPPAARIYRQSTPCGTDRHCFGTKP